MDSEKELCKWGTAIGQYCCQINDEKKLLKYKGECIGKVQ